MLRAAGREELADELLPLLGSFALSRAEVETLATEAEQVYDAAVEVRRTPVVADWNVSREVRDLERAGVRELLDGHHREALYQVMLLRTVVQGILEPAEPVELATLVAYQKGGVVSRTLVKKNAGTLTVFAFDQGQALSEHTAPFDAIVQVLDGEAELVIGGKPVPAKTGQTVLMPANVPHAVNAITRFKMLLIMVREPAKS